MKISQSSVSPKLKPKQKFCVVKQILHICFKVFPSLFFSSPEPELKYKILMLTKENIFLRPLQLFCITKRVIHLFWITIQAETVECS